MTTVSIPQKGQPFDWAFVAEIANAVNGIADKIAANSVAINSISGGANTTAQDLTASELRIVTRQVTVTGLKTPVAVDDKTTMTISYDGFQGTPIILGSVISGVSATCSFKDITSSSCTATIHMLTKGDPGTVVLHYMAIGVPA